MKRKVKKFNAGGLAEQALTVAPGYGGGGQGSGGLAGIQKSSLDIAQGTGMLEQGIQRIKGGGLGGGNLLGLGSSPTTSAGIYQNLMGRNITNAIPMQDAANYTLQQQARGFKKGGMVKAKSKAVKSTASKRGDGIATKGKTRGRMV